MAREEADRVAKEARERAEQIAREANEKLQQAIRKNTREENERVKEINQREQDRHGDILERMSNSSCSSQAYHSAVTGHQKSTKSAPQTHHKFRILCNKRRDESPNKHRSVSEVSCDTFVMPITPTVSKVLTNDKKRREENKISGRTNNKTKTNTKNPTEKDCRISQRRNRGPERTGLTTINPHLG